MTLNKYYRHFRESLHLIYNSNESTKITEMIFENLLQISKSDVIKFPEKNLAEAEKNKINEALNLLLSHRPVQYIIGEAWFYHLKFKVNESVLIPRPETEELVELIIHEIETKKDKLNILDIGTGSGCIPVAIKKNCKEINITSIDISNDAIKLAEINAADNDVEVSFIQMDFLKEENWEILETYDIIVSNPPYIPESEKNIMKKNVTDHEPHIALFVPEQNPFIFYEAVLNFSKHHLNKNGIIFFEIHEDLGKEMIELSNSYQYNAIIKKDIYSKDRMMIVNPYP